MTHTANKIIRTTLALAFAAGVGFTAMPDAQACGGGWWPEEELVDHRVAGMDRAEKDLEAGHYDAAAGAVLRMIPHISDYLTVKTSDPIVKRGMRVLAVATARKAGQLDIEKEIPEELQGWVGAERDQATANMLVAVAMLEKVGETKAGDAVFQSELGEAMAKLDSHRADGKAMLETLAEKDLLASPEALKTLAALRKADGDQKGEAAALERCEQVAKDPAICSAESRAHS
jgi:hypothetical protein